MKCSEEEESEEDDEDDDEWGWSVLLLALILFHTSIVSTIYGQRKVTKTEEKSMETWYIET